MQIKDIKTGKFVSHNPPIVLACKRCNKEFLTKAFRVDKAKYCSRKCTALVQASKHWIGRKHTEESKIKISENNARIWLGKKRPGIMKTGSESHNWIKDRTKLKIHGNTAKDRRSYAYTNWRTSVYMRDGFKCRISNKQCAGRIEAHHILSYTKFVELRYNINNGITLCHAHHPRKRAEEKLLIPFFQGMVEVTNVNF